jgi:hypothetical protein
MTTNTNNNARKVRVTGQSVAFLMLTEGLDAVRDLHKSAGIAKPTFDNAVDLLAGREEAASLADLRDELHPAGTGERGRPAAKVGDSRTYSAQQVNDGAVFIRLPVDLLGVGKGGDVKVSFADGRIVVTRA